MRPKVSIITPTYRRDPKVVAGCVGCVLYQTMPGWEHLVCSDGDSETAVEWIVAQAHDERTKYRFTGFPKVEGDFGNTVRNEMLKAAAGEYVLFLDDDNLIFPGFLDRMVREIEERKVDFVTCSVLYCYNPCMTKRMWPTVLEGDCVQSGRIDILQFLVRAEVARSIRWNTVGYNADGFVIDELAKGFSHARVPEMLGVHL